MEDKAEISSFKEITNVLESKQLTYKELFQLLYPHLEPNTWCSQPILNCIVEHVYAFLTTIRKHSNRNQLIIEYLKNIKYFRSIPEEPNTGETIQEEIY